MIRASLHYIATFTFLIRSIHGLSSSSRASFELGVLTVVNEFVWQRFRLEIIPLFLTCLKTLPTLKLPCINLPIMVSAGNDFILILGMVFLPQLLELYLAGTTVLEFGLPLLLSPL